jgi:hypothetical protein
LTGKNRSPRKIRKVWRAPMANALSHVRLRATSSLPDQRTSRLPGLAEGQTEADTRNFHAIAYDAGRSTIPSGTSPLVTRRQRAMSSLRASATIIVLRVLARPSAVREPLDQADHDRNDFKALLANDVRSCVHAWWAV